MSIASEIQRLQTAKTNIKTAIENKGVTVGDGTIDTYAEKIGEIEVGGYDQGYEDGKNSVVDFVQYTAEMRGIRRNLIDEKEITLNLNVSEVLDFLFIHYGDGTTSANNNVEHITINCPNQPTSMYSMFHTQTPNDTVLKHITINFDTSQVKRCLNLFRGLEALEVIDGVPLDFSNASDLNIFNACKSVREFRVVPNCIKVSFSVSPFASLSAETIQSIIDGLADLTGSTAQTLTLHATVCAKLTETQKATITAKNWTLVY